MIANFFMVYGFNAVINMVEGWVCDVFYCCLKVEDHEFAEKRVNHLHALGKSQLRRRSIQYNGINRSRFTVVDLVSARKR